jgi:hypothetical protein
VLPERSGDDEGTHSRTSTCQALLFAKAQPTRVACPGAHGMRSSTPLPALQPVYRADAAQQPESSLRRSRAYRPPVCWLRACEPSFQLGRLSTSGGWWHSSPRVSSSPDALVLVRQAFTFTALTPQPPAILAHSLAAASLSTHPRPHYAACFRNGIIEHFGRLSQRDPHVRLLATFRLAHATAQCQMSPTSIGGPAAHLPSCSASLPWTATGSCRLSKGPSDWEYIGALQGFRRLRLTALGTDKIQAQFWSVASN